MITVADIGKILKALNNAEIPFRLENLVAIGYRWALVGYEGNPEPGQMRLYRAEIDDGIQGTLKYHDKVPEKFCAIGLTKDSFSVQDANEQLHSLHLMQKDWLERGEADDICTAVAELCDAACRHYPDSEFTEWYEANFARTGS